MTVFGSLTAWVNATREMGPLLALVFALYLRWLPVGGWSSPASLVLPAITLAGPYIAYVARLMRSSMLEVLGSDFVRTARAKGLHESRAVYQHTLKVAILPVVSFLGPLAANLVTGSIVVESIFNIPGMGSFFVTAILTRDERLSLYDAWADKLIPRIGKAIADDEDSYRYLVESIRRFPPMPVFKAMIEKAGFTQVNAEPILGGLVAIHSGWKV